MGSNDRIAKSDIKMKIRRVISWVFSGLGFVLVLAAFNNLDHKEAPISRARLVEGFVTPADSMQTAVYWYWISDNISKDGVVKDLHAMK